MHMQTVKSSMMHSIGYEGGTLHVRFKADGPVYEYAGVPAEEYAKLMAAESVGSHFGKHIRNQYTAKKLEQKEKE